MLGDIYTISYFLNKYGYQQKPHWEQLHRNEQEICNVKTLAQTNKKTPNWAGEVWWGLILPLHFIVKTDQQIIIYNVLVRMDLVL